MNQPMDKITKKRHLEELVAKARETAISRLDLKHAGGSDVLSEEQLDIIVKSLDSLIVDIQQGNLEQTDGDPPLITPLRPVIDWGEPDGSELSERLLEIEKFYTANF